MLISYTKKTKSLYLFYQVFGGKTRLPKRDTRPRQNHREKSDLETFSTAYASRESGNPNTKNHHKKMRKLPKHLIAILKKIHHLLHRQHQTQVWTWNLYLHHKFLYTEIIINLVIQMTNYSFNRKQKKRLLHYQTMY
jgi:hypothetical protein